MLPLGARSYTVTRRAAVTYVNGLPVRATPTTFALVASVQPLSGADLHRAPEGLRRTDARKAYTSLGNPGLRTVLQAAHEADLITVDGVRFEVYHVEVNDLASPLPHQLVWLQASDSTEEAPL